MSDSVQPHRQQPTRLLCPWDSPDKNTGVGCHFLLHCMKGKSENEVVQSCPTLSDPHGLEPTRLLCPWDFSRQEYWSGVPLASHFFLKKDQGLKFCDTDLKDWSCTHHKSGRARIDFLQFDFCSWICHYWNSAKSPRVLRLEIKICMSLCDFHGLLREVARSIFIISH